MPSQTVVVGSRVGLHARPAALIADAVAKSGVPVTLATPGGAPVDAGSSLLIMTLGAKQGSEVIVTSEDPSVLERIAAMVAEDLDAAATWWTRGPYRETSPRQLPDWRPRLSMNSLNRAASAFT
jgi:phosphocarrier protein